MNATSGEAVQDADDEEVQRYEQAFRETRRVLDEGIRQLSILLQEESNSARRDQISLKRLRLQRDRTRLANANIAFHIGRALMNPPSVALVDEIIGLAKEASAFVVERASASAVLSLATLALTRFAEIQEIGS